MTDSGERCPYCSVTNEPTIVSWSHQAWASFLSSIGYNATRTSSTKSLKIDCVFCERNYTLLKFDDLDWVKDNLQWAYTVREGMIKLFGSNLSRDKIINNIQGVAMRVDKTLDICFKYRNKRAYLNCVKENGKYMGLYLEEIYF